MQCDANQVNNQRLIKPLFLVPQKSEVEHAQKLDAELNQSIERYNENQRRNFGKPLSFKSSPAGQGVSPDIARLVKECKSPTKTKLENQRENLLSSIRAIRTKQKPSFPIFDRETGEYFYSATDAQIIELQPANATGSRKAARVYHRAWSDEYRIRCESSTAPMAAPDSPEGERFTAKLTERAARKMTDSGAFTAVTRGGYTTFLTLTFDEKARERIIKIKPFPIIDKDTNGGKFSRIGQAGDYCAGVHASGMFYEVEFTTESTIGREVSRFFDAAQKMHQRGWVAVDSFTCSLDENMQPDLATGQKHKIEPYRTVKHTEQGASFELLPLDYMWVAEMPKNESGENNPHCHVLMRWQVPYRFFRSWAARLESIWGLGFANLERIKDANAASGYLLKALGYLSKGASGEQGLIRGNRYNISASARAPAWECICSYELESMTAIINELREKWQLQDAKIKSEIAEREKQKRIIKSREMSNDKKASILSRIDAKLAEFSEKLAENRQQRAAYASEYQITFKGGERVKQFIDWAINRRGWSASSKGEQYGAAFSERFDNQIIASNNAIKAARIKTRKLYEIARDSASYLTALVRESIRYEPIEKPPVTEFDENGREWELVTI